MNLMMFDLEHVILDRLETNVNSIDILECRRSVTNLIEIRSAVWKMEHADEQKNDYELSLMRSFHTRSA
jgi:hypothetical protein